AGNRLGQGGGYYDRWFEGHPDAMRVGIAWSVQELPAVPRDVWDMPLHAVATEKEWMCP
ncbi:MAG: 5-formyltetrahydrofolate cyclo-ligase, partial [Sphingomonas bacterium]|nr:5-formyltetrahydrofolate cyclo-ligase [Sphingomonas bacterium]